MLNVLPIVVGGVSLGEKYLVLLSVPLSRPVLVGPAQAEGKLRTTGAKHLVEGAAEEPTTIEPVVIVAEARDAIGASEIRLGFSGLGNAQVVEAEVGGQVRLIVPLEERLGPHHVPPLRETRAPPLVVLRDGMVLGQVEGESTERRHPGLLVHDEA